MKQEIHFCFSAYSGQNSRKFWGFWQSSFWINFKAFLFVGELFFKALSIFELDFVLILSPEGKVPGSILAAARPSNIFCLMNLILGMMNKKRFLQG